MEIFNFYWHYYLYVPLFNLLVWLYNNYSGYNLGVAVIILTVILRVILLPFSFLTERGKVVSEQARKEIREVDKDYANDPIKKKLAIRQILKRKKLRPWSNAVVLGVQAVVLILLYNVFIGGINTEAKLHLIYPGIDRPDFVNTHFLWFDIGEKNQLMALIAAAYLFLEIIIERWSQRHKLTRRDMIFIILFPLSVYFALSILPSVKSIFILTTLIFSTIISIITYLIKFSLKQAKQSK